MFLPPRVASSMANIGPLVLCTRVTNAITYTDPSTKRSATTEVQGTMAPYTVLVGTRGRLALTACLAP